MVPVLVLLIRIQGSSGSGFGIRNPDPDPVVLNREKYQIFTTFYFFTEFLMTFTMYNFELGYVQGMNDLLVPILVTIDSEVEVFWGFVAFMDRMVNCKRI